MYDKPKVTIDLEEYTDLVKKVHKYGSNDELIMAKEVAIVALNARGDQRIIVQELERKGITFWTTTNQGNGRPEFEINFRRHDKPSRV